MSDSDFIEISMSVVNEPTSNILIRLPKKILHRFDVNSVKWEFVPLDNDAYPVGDYDASKSLKTRLRLFGRIDIQGNNLYDFCQCTYAEVPGQEIVLQKLFSPSF